MSDERSADPAVARLKEAIRAFTVDAGTREAPEPNGPAEAAWLRLTDALLALPDPEGKRIAALAVQFLEADAARLRELREAAEAVFCGDFQSVDESQPVVPEEIGAGPLRPVAQLRSGPEARRAFLQVSAFGGSRDRPFLGQPWTWVGERGRADLPPMRFRDLGDILVGAQKVVEEAEEKEPAPARSVPEVLAEVGVMPELIPVAEEKLRKAGLLSPRAKASVKREVEHNG